MIVPATVEFQAIPIGGVCSNSPGIFYMKIAASTVIDLSLCDQNASIASNALYTYFPNAYLALG